MISKTLRTARSRALRHPTSYVFLFVLAAGLVMTYARAEPPPSRAELVGILLLSLVYLLVGTVGFMCVLGPRPPAYKIAYLAFQIALGMFILYLGRGNGWLVMLPLASHSIALFSPREAVLPCLLITLGIAWNTSQLLPGWIPLLQSAVVFGSAVFFAAVFTNISISDARRREEIERLAAQLEQANCALRDYTAQAEELAALQERNRLARDIHDGLGHYLTTMHLQINLAAAMLDTDPAGARQALDKTQALLHAALADVRRSVAALRSESGMGVDLRDALQPLITESQVAGLITELTVSGEVRSLPPEVEMTLYRTVQEGLTNVQKHARAKRVQVRLDYAPGAMHLSVQDDGEGSAQDITDMALLKDSFGLFGLRERVRLLGGEMHIHTAPQQGFQLEIHLPTA